MRIGEKVLTERVDIVTAVQQTVCDRNCQNRVVGEPTTFGKQLEVGRFRRDELVNRTNDVSRNCAEHIQSSLLKRVSATFQRMIRSFLLVIVASAVTACSQPPERQIVDDAASALGGRNRILAVKTLVIEGEGTNGNLGQDMTMDAASQQFVVSGYKRSVDVVNLRARTEQTRTPNFAYFQGPQAQKQVLGVDGDVGYNVAPNGNATRVSNAVAKDRRADIQR